MVVRVGGIGGRPVRRLGWLARVALVSGLVSVALLAAGASASVAGNIVTSSGIVAGGLTLQNAGSATLSTTLTGDDAVVTGNLGEMTVVDATGSGAGWNLTATGTAFTASGRSLPDTALTITGVTVSRHAGRAPVNQLSYPVTVPTVGAVQFFAASADTGMGTFTLVPSVALSVPADSYSGSYRSTMTLSVVSGP